MNLPPRAVTEPDELVDLFARERPVHPYGLADLDEPYWSRSRWWRRGDAAVGVLRLPGEDAFTAVYAISPEDPAGTIDLLIDLDGEIPAGALATGPVGMTGRVGRTRPIASLGPHTKLHLVDPRRLVDDTGAVFLGPGDAEEVMELYATDPGAAFFLPTMLDDNLYAGVRVDGRLVAGAATHGRSERHRVAAIGGVITDPAHRGRGHGAVVTSAIARRIHAEGSLVGLNVHSDNATAIGLYRRLGFEIVHEYEEIEYLSTPEGPEPNSNR